MARIAGVEIPSNKRIEIALRYVYGIGPVNSLRILNEANVPNGIRAKDLTEEQISRLNAVIDKGGYVVEGALRRQIAQNIQRLKDIRCYRGIRHIKGLPVRGQKTRKHARTRKGPKKTVAGKKKPKAPS